jgi:GT2 family glycosyltransferase
MIYLMRILRQENKIYLTFDNDSKVRIDEHILNIFEKRYLNKNLEIEYPRNFENTVIQLLEKLKESVTLPEPKINISKFNEEPLVSIILVNWNGKKHLKDCLDSIKSQDYKKIEAVLVDNNSNDGSIEFIEKEYPWVKLVKNSRNDGFSKGNNIGEREANGDLVFLLNNDTKIAVNCVSLLVGKYLKSKEKYKVGAIVPKMRFFYHPGFINSIGNSVFMRGWGSDNFIGSVDLGQYDNIERTMSACFGAVMIPREIIKEIGLLDKKYYMYYEDSDWSFRVRKRGYEIISESQALVYHKFGASTDSRPSDFKLYHIVKNRIRFVLKNGQLGTIKHSLKHFAKEDIRNIIGYTKKGQFKTVFAYKKSYVNLLTQLPGLYFYRRRERTKRVVSDQEIFNLSVHPVTGLYIDGELALTTNIIRKYYSKVDNGSIIYPKNMFIKDLVIWPENSNFILLYPNKNIEIPYNFQKGEYEIKVCGIVNENTLIRSEYSISNQLNTSSSLKSFSKYILNVDQDSNNFSIENKSPNLVYIEIVSIVKREETI